MTLRVTDIDHGWAKMMSSMMNLDDSHSVCVGPDPNYIMGAEKQAKEKGKTQRRNAAGRFTSAIRSYYPFFLEYGTRFMAARPFMRWTFDAHDNYRRELRQLAEGVFDGARKGTVSKSSLPLLNSVASKMVADIRKTIVGMGLIDTGRMYRSISLWRWRGA
jgi:hypothetical protein